MTENQTAQRWSDSSAGWGAQSIYTAGAAELYGSVDNADLGRPGEVVLTSPRRVGAHAEQWSTATYSGPRRHRPGRTSESPTPTPTTAAPTPAAPPAAEGAADKGLLSSSRAMAVASLISRITGFLRTSMLVAALGITVHGVGDAYNVANNFPNMVYELLLGGVLSSVLIPLLVHAQHEDDDDGIAYTQRLLSVATAALAVMTALAVICSPLIAGVFVSDHSQRHLTTTFAYLLLPEIFFYGIGAMFMAVLNIRHSYAAGAWSPVLNNVILMATIGAFWVLPGPKTLSPSTITSTQVLVLGIGTSLGIAAQALVLIPALRGTGFHWKWRLRARPNEIGRMKEVGALGGWVLIYVVASQIGVSVIAKVGVAHGAFTVFTNADLLLQMPYGILVVSLLTALMPRISRSAARGDTTAVIDDLSLGARLSTVALLPITAGMIAMGSVLGVTLFAYGNTPLAGGRLIGTSLAISAFGLLPFAIVMLQLRVFYAMRDGRTPTLINIFMVTTKVAVVLVCDSTLHGSAQIAEALNTATSASYVIGALVGHLVLTRRLGQLGFASVGRAVLRMGAASALGGAAAWGIVLASTHELGNGHIGSLVALIVGSTVGLAVMGAVAWRLRIPEIRQIISAARA
jgi:putative peptidoglycan lipid II flippase